MMLLYLKSSFLTQFFSYHRCRRPLHQLFGSRHNQKQKARAQTLVARSLGPRTPSWTLTIIMPRRTKACSLCHSMVPDPTSSISQSTSKLRPGLVYAYWARAGAVTTNTFDVIYNRERDIHY